LLNNILILKEGSVITYYGQFVI